mmetsp:Transcript_33762/g.79023  ORF Transcript_33762/g.79023 Transcript_33762/m.79023 type:complete len:107 (-) Transcript_33762:394-714(-)
MSHVARGSSMASATPYSLYEHRGRTPAKGWQIELLLTCALRDGVALKRRLCALGDAFRSELQAGESTLATEDASLSADAATFRNNPEYTSQAKHLLSASSLPQPER